MLEQPGARLGRADRAPVEQGRADVGLQHRDVLRHRGLRVAELARGRREGLQASHDYERTKKARVHTHQYR